jgi:hypothetical protein
MLRDELAGRRSNLRALIPGPLESIWPSIGNCKSLAPYRDCLGRESTGMVWMRDRGSFDRGDLKEAAGGASRSMEPRVCFLGFGPRDVGR